MSADGAVAGLPEALRARIEEKMGKRFADFRFVRLGDAGAVFVAEKLRGNTVVDNLQFDSCGIGAVGARALAESLAEDNVTLKKLDFFGNKVGDDGTESMAQMLKKNTTLEQLHLNRCGVGAVGARALGEALQGLITTLKYLGLNGNDIGDDGAEALAEALRWDESLEKLYLKRCHLTDVGASSLFSALRESNSTLKRLHLDFNGIENNAIEDSIDELVTENKAVQHASAERRARCLLFCCLKLAPSAHKHAVPSIGAVPVPVLQYAVEHAGALHVAKRFECGTVVVGQLSAGVRARSSSSSELQPAPARRREK